MNSDECFAFTDDEKRIGICRYWFVAVSAMSDSFLCKGCVEKDRKNKISVSLQSANICYNKFV